MMFGSAWLCFSPPICSIGESLGSGSLPPYQRLLARPSGLQERPGSVRRQSGLLPCLRDGVFSQTAKNGFFAKKEPGMFLVTHIVSLFRCVCSLISLRPGVVDTLLMKRKQMQRHAETCAQKRFRPMTSTTLGHA